MIIRLDGMCNSRVPLCCHLAGEYASSAPLLNVGESCTLRVDLPCVGGAAQEIMRRAARRLRVVGGCQLRIVSAWGDGAAVREGESSSSQRPIRLLCIAP